MRSLRPENEGASLDRYRVITVVERRRILSDLAGKRALAGLFVADQLALTARIVATEGEQVALEAEQDEEAGTAWRKVLVSPVVAVAFLDEVKVQFTAVRLALGYTSVGREPRKRVLLAPFPDPVWRIQRRRGHRVEVPASARVFARVPWPTGASANVRVADLSISGLGLAVPAHTLLPPVGTVWDVARLNVIHDDTQHLLPCALTVTRTQRGTATRPARIGCAIDAVPLGSARVLQELVIALERGAAAPAAVKA